MRNEVLRYPGYRRIILNAQDRLKVSGRMLSSEGIE